MQQATEMVLKGCADKANVNKQQPMALQQLHDDGRKQQNEMRKTNMLANMNSEVSTLQCRIGTAIIE